MNILEVQRLPQFFNQMAPQVPVLTFSSNEHSKSLLALDKDIELGSFTDVAIDKRTESKATESQIKTDVEENPPLTNLQFFSG